MLAGYFHIQCKINKRRTGSTDTTGTGTGTTHCMCFKVKCIDLIKKKTCEKWAALTHSPVKLVHLYNHEIFIRVKKAKIIIKKIGSI